MKPTPVTRKEQYLYALGEIQTTLEPVTREEMYLANLCGQNYALPLPCRRYEQYLYKMNGGDVDIPEPVTRLEMFLYRACDNDYETPEPVTREEMYWDEYIKAYIETKTITGTLPLTFTTSETKLRSWTIYGADIKHEKTATGKSISFYTDEDKLRDWTIYGNDKVGKNLLPLTNYSTSGLGNVTYDIDERAGTITANGSTANTGGAQCFIKYVPTETLKVYFSGCPADGSLSTYDAYCWDDTTNARCKKWDDTTASATDLGSGAIEVTLPAGHSISLNCRIKANYTAKNLMFKPMLRLPDTSADFEPYQQGVGERTPNLYTFADDNKTDADVEFVADSATGTITATGRSSSTSGSFISLLSIATFEAGTYEFTGDAGASLTTYYSYVREAGSSTTIAGDREGQNRQFTLSAPTQLRIYFRVLASNPDTVHIFRPMISRVGETPTSFIPYGYIVPVQSGGVTTNIFIGSDPLTAGESVSKTSTGVDIPTIADATNVVQTPLFYNQPTIEIEYSYTGIGERTINMLDSRAYRTPVDTGVIVDEINVDSGVLKFSLDSHSTGGKGLAFEGIPFENGKRYVIDLWNNGTMSTWNPSIRLRRRDTGADIANVGGEFYQVGTNAFFFTYDESLAPEGAYLYIGTGMDKIVDVRSFYIAECPEGESRHFEPFGYQVPFKADQTGQMISYMTKVYIGTEPLKAGESVSNTKDARTRIGENTISTTLTDPVTMKIKYKE